MLVRTISGTVAVLLVIALLALNHFFGFFATITLCILAAFATYEMLHNTGCIKNAFLNLIAVIYAAAAQLAYNVDMIDVELVTIAYVVIVALFAVFAHKTIGERQVAMALAMPVVIAYAFAALERLLNHADGHGLFYFALLLNFSSVADTSAYFVGKTFGKHKLAPVVSPKKTIEGSVGGLIGSLIGAVIFTFGYEFLVKGADVNLWLLLAITPVMCILGMLGDLFTSAIKRNYDVKDYGNLIPGHGGILDRTDSILMVAPALDLFLRYVPIVNL